MRAWNRTMVSLAAVLALPLWASAKKPPKPPPGGDEIAPAAVSDLQEYSVTQFRVTLQWTATPDDGSDCGSGPASAYEFRYSTAPIVDQADWDAAWVPYGTQLVPGEPCVPLGESWIVHNLVPDTTYYFRMKVADEVPNWSELSNEAVVTTPPGTWSWEQVDNIYKRTASAFAPDGTPSLVYFSPEEGGIVFADYNGATWDVEFVGPCVGGSWSYGLVYDGAGTPLITHHAETGKGRKKTTELRVYRKSGSTWDSETVDVTTGGYNAIAVDVAGNPAIGYRNEQDVKLARWNDATSSWDLEVVESIGGYPEDVGRFSVAFDPDDGAPSLSYSVSRGAGEVADLRFARRNGSVWLVETVDAAVNLHAGTPGGLAYDPTTGHPSMVHHLGPPSYLGVPWTIHLATWDGADWVIDLIDEDDGTAVPNDDTSLAFDASGVPWVAYSRTSGDCVTVNELRTAYRIGGAWESEVLLESLGGCIVAPDLKFDPSGILTVAAARQRYGRRE